MITHAAENTASTFTPINTGIQPKLEIGAPNDRYEKEADAVADRVVMSPSASPVQLMSDEEEGIQMKPQQQLVQLMQDDEEKLQMKCEDCEKEKLQPKLIQPFGTGNGVASNNVEQGLSSSKGGGTALPEHLSHEMGTKIGADFSGVRIHTGSNAVQMNREIGAKAFTHGNDVYFNRGQYNPHSSNGKRLLAHELTHTVQQGAAPAVQSKEQHAHTTSPIQQLQTMRIQRDCDADEAIRWYSESATGREVQWTRGLVDTLLRVVGTDHQALYDSAVAEGEIGPAFVALVCQAQQTLGLTGDDVDGKIGPTTISTWENWRTGGEHGINYNRLFEDGRLTMGIAVGHEFHSTEFVAIEQLLVTEGFTLASTTTTMKTYTATRSFAVQGDNTAPPRNIDIVIDLISEQSATPADTYGEFLTDREIAIYSGHARYGTGPDFDPKNSVAENFVIGVNSALHDAGSLTSGYDAHMNEILENQANDLEALSTAGEFDPDTYRVWFFNACSTINYLDEIRGGLVHDGSGNNLSDDNLRVMGTNRAIVSDAIPIIQGILNMQTMQEIVDAMDAYENVNAGTSNRDYYFAD